MKTICIVGLGLIGGSMALDLRRRGYAGCVLGVENDPAHAAAARQIGLADEIVGLDEGLRRADLVILAIPAGTAARLLPAVLDCFQAEGGSKKIVLDTCSIKREMVRSAAGHPARARYVASHPMAGTEYSGPWAAMEGLFDGRASILADTADSDPDAVAEVERLYDCLHMRTLRMPADSHDIHTAYVSHISHITSFALALTVLNKEKDEKHIFDLASGGFSSTVRLAKSNADMWVPILLQNRDNVLQVLDTYKEKLQAFRDAIDHKDGDTVRTLIEEANHIRKIIR